MPGLQVSEIIRGPLRVGGGLKDRPLVVLQDLEPGRNIGGVVVPDVRGNAKVSAQERRAELGDQFFPGIPLIANMLAPKVARQT